MGSRGTRESLENVAARRDTASGAQHSHKGGDSGIVDEHQWWMEECRERTHRSRGQAEPDSLLVTVALHNAMSPSVTAPIPVHRRLSRATTCSSSLD